MIFHRRAFIKSLTAAFAAPVAASAFPTSSSDTAVKSQRSSGNPRHPNVIFMICDDLGYGDLGCYGSKLPTPNLDAMAAGGFRFTRYNSAHPICSASRAAILTGRYGLRCNTVGAFGPHSPTGTSLDETLLSDLFHSGGYKTKAIGKWHLGDAPEYLPTCRGFDSYYGVPYSVDMKPLPLIRDKKILEEDTNRDVLTARYTEEAVRYIEESNENPFFMYLAFSYPHDPARVSEPFTRKTRFGNFGDAIAEIDWSVGEILTALDRRGITSDTVVCFTSDHGPWYQGSPGLLRGRKASTFEGGFRVPFMIRRPGTIAAGRVTDEWHSALDVLPTLSAMCGLPSPPKPLDGVDFSGIFGANEKPLTRKPILYFCPMGNHGLDLHCIRHEQWKLRVAQGIEGEVYINDRTTSAKGSAWLLRPELYNLVEDPAESYDVAKLHPEIVTGLLENLDKQMASFPPQVVEAYTKLKQKKADISTPPGASPRPSGAPLSPGSWEPEDRR